MGGAEDRLSARSILVTVRVDIAPVRRYFSGMAEFPPVLVAEDEDTDIFLLRRAFATAGLPYPLVVVQDGREAIQYLEGEGQFTNRRLHPLPCLLLLDLKMPRMNGFEVLDWLADKPEIARFPVIVLSSSSHDSDIQTAREKGASEYCIKPHGLDALVRLLCDVEARWLAREGAKGRPRAPRIPRP